MVINGCNGPTKNISNINENGAMKSYSYRNQLYSKFGYTPTQHDIDYLIQTLEKIHKSTNDNFSNAFVDAAKAVKQLIPEFDQIDLIWFLSEVKPHCRSSCYLDE